MTADCVNCDGRQCMACVSREAHDVCSNDCPACCMPASHTDDIEFELNALGYRKPRTVADFADDSRIHLIKLWGDFTVVAVPIDAVSERAERTIAEIIGWERHAERDYGNGQMVEWFQPVDYVQPADFFPHPTVEDLLAWFMDRNLEVSAFTRALTADVVCVNVYDWDRAYDEGFCGDSLRAALEAAARGVAE